MLDYLYASSSKKDQNIILQEFYSPEFVVFGEDETTKEKSLGEIIQVKPEKKNQILDNLRKVRQSKRIQLSRDIHSDTHLTFDYSIVRDDIVSLIGRLASVKVHLVTDDACR